MIYEYALEPALVVDWAIAGIGGVVAQFGLDLRRLVSDFPKDWRGHVYGELYRRFEFDDSSLEFQNAQPELDAYLQILTDRMVPRGRVMGHEAAWLDAALEEHHRSPFHGILVSSKPVDAPDCLLIEKDVNNIRNRFWRLPSVGTTAKSAEEIANVLAPMLGMATQIFVIDPNFAAEKRRFRESLSAIVKRTLQQPRPVDGLPKLFLITGIEREFKGKYNRDTQSENNVASDIAHKCREYIPKLIPQGLQIQVVILKNRPDGERLHNRYVLTDVGGASLPFGIDEDNQANGQDTTDDLSPLHKETFERRWKQYCDLKGFDLAHVPFTVNGAGKS
jgi:hypothetical protein